jgi:selenide,water dikinase
MSGKRERLTDFANCAGCAGKLSSQGVAQILRALPTRSNDPNLLVGTETCDDAGVYRITDGLALVQTVDFFPPLVDDPFQFGQIAAANALSDVYAMNGRPLTALNIVAFPDEELPLSVLAQILQGAADRVEAAGAVTVGGHSLRDTEVKFGLSVTGLVEPSAVLTNAGARPGDALVLTKPLGTGFITTASKKRDCPADLLDRAVASMTQLNAVGRDACNAVGNVHAATDVTGFGLAGHAAEMAEGSAVTIAIEVAALPVIEGSEPLAVPHYYTRAYHTNRAHLADRLRLTEGVDAQRVDYVFDPQTSGGLLVSIAPDCVDRLVSELRARGAQAAAVVGRVMRRQDPFAIVLY